VREPCLPGEEGASGSDQASSVDSTAQQKLLVVKNIPVKILSRLGSRKQFSVDYLLTTAKSCMTG
jgi:hypothetical protein